MAIANVMDRYLNLDSSQTHYLFDRKKCIDIPDFNTKIVGSKVLYNILKSV